MMLTLIKKLSGALSNGAFLSGHPEIAAMDLDRDYPEIDRLFQQEQWPFLRSDLEVSHRQPGAVALVARKNGRFAGFFVTHIFGPIAYLDMMIVAPEFRKAGIARPLYFEAIRALKRQGARSFVVHTTNDSARVIRLLGFASGQTFTLLRRTPGPAGRPTGIERPNSADLVALGKRHKAELVRFDASAFGLEREAWIDALLEEPSTRFVGLLQEGALRAALCLRPRRGGALCLDGVNARRSEELRDLASTVVGRHSDKTLECFARTGSQLHRILEGLDFAVPDFFREIGPLTEWRKGKAHTAGTSQRVQCLSWF